VEVASILRASVRETDLPARYGGEEFVVICPETDEAEASVVAERVRAAVEAAYFDLGAGVECTITCSAGVATYPEDARTETELIRSADAALYHAKESGKNRVVRARRPATHR
jgi:diguanylate cyclase (GGDEF)-like protein